MIVLGRLPGRLDGDRDRPKLATTPEEIIGLGFRGLPPSYVEAHQHEYGAGRTGRTVTLLRPDARTAASIGAGTVSERREAACSLGSWSVPMVPTLRRRRCGRRSTWRR